MFECLLAIFFSSAPTKWSRWRRASSVIRCMLLVRPVVRYDQQLAGTLPGSAHQQHTIQHRCLIRKHFTALGVFKCRACHSACSPTVFIACLVTSSKFPTATPLKPCAGCCCMLSRPAVDGPVPARAPAHVCFGDVILLKVRPAGEVFATVCTSCAFHMTLLQPGQLRSCGARFQCLTINFIG